MRCDKLLFFWFKRILAWIIDLAIVLIPSILLIVLGANVAGFNENGFGIVIVILGGNLIPILYFFYMSSLTFKKKGTIGKKLLKLSVEPATDKTPSIPKTIIRECVLKPFTILFSFWSIVLYLVGNWLVISINLNSGSLPVKSILFTLGTTFGMSTVLIMFIRNSMKHGGQAWCDLILGINCVEKSSPSHARA